MDRVVVAAMRGDRGVVVGSCTEVHIATAIEHVMRVRTHMEGMRVSPGVGW